MLVLIDLVNYGLIRFLTIAQTSNQASESKNSSTKIQPIILTGDRPTGPLQLGHYVGSLRQRVALQNEYKTFVMIADAQALTDNANNLTIDPITTKYENLYLTKVR